MELILLQDVQKVGRKGERVCVRDGFGRNFLLPRKWALVCTKANSKFVEDLAARNANRREKEKEQAGNLAERLAALKLVVEVRAGEKEKLFGSVTAEDICTALAREGHRFDKKQVHLKESIRTLGTHPVTLELYPEVKATIAVEVVRKP